MPPAFRFKTIDECHTEHGPDWRIKLHFNSGGQMDYLMGTEVTMTEEDYANYLDSMFFSITDRSSSVNNGGPWSISPGMLAEIIEEPPEPVEPVGPIRRTINLRS